MSREVNMIGMAIAKGLEEQGHVGATHMGTAFDAWIPGKVDYAPNFENIPAFWTETAFFSTRPRTPIRSPISPEEMRDLLRQFIPARGRPGSGGCAMVDYMETASLAVLEYASKYKESLLDRYKAGVDQIARGRKEPPYAYVIPAQQRDPVAAVELLRRLAFALVAQLSTPVTIEGRTYPAGAWVCPPIRNSPRWRAKSSTYSTTPTCDSILAAPRSVPTTQPAGRCRSPWGSTSPQSRHAAPRWHPVEHEMASVPRSLQRPPNALQPHRCRRRSAVRQRSRHRLQHERRGCGDRAARWPCYRQRIHSVGGSSPEQRVPRNQPRVEAGRNDSVRRRALRDRGARRRPDRRRRPLRHRRRLPPAARAARARPTRSSRPATRSAAPGTSSATPASARTPTCSRSATRSGRGRRRRRSPTARRSCDYIQRDGARARRSTATSASATASCAPTGRRERRALDRRASSAPTPARRSS